MSDFRGHFKSIWRYMPCKMVARTLSDLQIWTTTMSLRQYLLSHQRIDLLPQWRTTSQDTLLSPVERKKPIKITQTHVTFMISLQGNGIKVQEWNMNAAITAAACSTTLPTYSLEGQVRLSASMLINYLWPSKKETLISNKCGWKSCFLILWQIVWTLLSLQSHLKTS